MIRTYTELIRIPTFEDRFEYLRLDGRVGEDTFAFDRYLNQDFYKSKEWKQIRNLVIVRDLGCDLAFSGREITGKILVHHMNPLTKKDILDRTEFLMDPEYLVCTMKSTHDAIHYGDRSSLVLPPPDRSPNDTIPWRR